jgi:hypothetical protein
VRDRAAAIATTRSLDPTDFGNYALRRWFCFWGARIAEMLFLEHPGVAPGPAKHRQIDFTIDGVPFDLKTSDVPRIFAGSIDGVAASPNKAASWLYAHQSREGRHHNANRLFLLLCDAETPEEAWRLRANVSALRMAISRFMDRRTFVDLRLPGPDGRERDVLTAVIPVVPHRAGRQLPMF